MLFKYAVLALAVVSSAYCQTFIPVSVPPTGVVSFASPSFPGQYAQKLNIVYNITGSTEHGLVFEAESFDLDPTEDALVFTENVPEVGEVTIGVIRRTFQDIPRKGGYRFRSTTNAVRATFVSDSQANTVVTGFKINVLRERLDGRTALTATCLKGKITFSEENKDNTDKLIALFSVDRTLACRMKLHAVHTWILSQLAEKPKSLFMSSAPVAVTCSGGVLKVSDSNPDDSTTDELTFTTTGNLKCRTIFAEFLKQI